jgi:hypothetical protein
VRTFLVERRLPGLSREHLAMVQRSLQAVAPGAGVRYARTIWVPAQERCLCLFEAESIDAVKRANETAQVPFDAVTEALHLAAPTPGSPEPRR